MCHRRHMEKIDARKISTDAQQQLRYQAIHLRKKGLKYKDIADIIGVQLATVCQWWKLYERGGIKAIHIQKRGRPTGNCRTLTPEQETDVQRAIRDKCPDQLKLPFALWTRIAVQQVTKDRYGINMPIRTVGHYLKRWGFTPQKPLRRAFKQNPKAVKQWLDVQYPAIAQKAKKEKAEIHWGNETALCNETYHGRSYAPRGQTPAIKLWPKCERVNLISTVTNQGKVRFDIPPRKWTQG